MSQMIPEFSTKTFSDFYPDVDTFLTDYENVGIPTIIKRESATTLFYLLYAKHGNDPIANRDPNQFKYRLFSVIFQYGPEWEKRLDIQEKLRALTIEELMDGSKQILNRADNPSIAPSTDARDELPYIQSQSVSKNTRSKIDAYAYLDGMLNSNITEMFLKHFTKLFRQFVYPENPILYESED